MACRALGGPQPGANVLELGWGTLVGPSGRQATHGRRLDPVRGGYLGFSASSELFPLLVLFLVYGLYFGLTEPVERAWVAGLAPPDRRGAAFGWYHAAVGLAALPASVLFGALYTMIGPGVAFGVCST